MTARKLRPLTGIAWALLAAYGGGTALAVEPDRDLHVTLGPWRTRELKDRPGREGQVLHERTATFSGLDPGYALTYESARHPDRPDTVFPVEGYIGLPGPTPCNWYHSGCMWIAINGRDIGRTPLHSIRSVESGPRGIVDLVWYGKEANVRARVAAIAPHRCLFWEISLEPKMPVKTVEVRLRCYPSFFTAWHKRKGDRRVHTAKRMIPQDTTAEADAGNEWWAVYTDTVFDPARGEGEGPCGMAVLPEDATTLRFEPKSYPVETRIQCPPGTRRIRLALWEFPGEANQAVLDEMEQRAGQAAEAMRTVDLTPEAIRSVDLEQLRGTVADALNDDSVRERLDESLSAARAWLDAYAGVETGADLGIRGQEELLAALQEYRQLSWKIRLARLLSAIEKGAP